MATIDGLPYVINGIEVFNNKRIVIDRVAVDAAAEDNPDTNVLDRKRRVEGNGAERGGWRTKERQKCKELRGR